MSKIVRSTLLGALMGWIFLANTTLAMPTLEGPFTDNFSVVINSESGNETGFIDLPGFDTMTGTRSLLDVTIEVAFQLNAQLSITNRSGQTQNVSWSQALNGTASAPGATVVNEAVTAGPGGPISVRNNTLSRITSSGNSGFVNATVSDLSSYRDVATINIPVILGFSQVTLSASPGAASGLDFVYRQTGQATARVTYSWEAATAVVPSPAALWLVAGGLLLIRYRRRS